MEIQIIDNSSLHGIRKIDHKDNNEKSYLGECWRKCECGGTIKTIGWFATGEPMNRSKFNMPTYYPSENEMLSNVSSICDLCDYNEYS